MALSNEKFTVATVDKRIETLSTQTQNLLLALQYMRTELLEIVDIQVTQESNTTLGVNEKAGVFEDFILKTDHNLYKIRDNRKILEHRPSQLNLLTTNLVDNLLILLNKP